MIIRLISFTDRGARLANRLAEGLSGTAMRCGQPLSLDDWTKEGFSAADALIFVGAAGIAVRAIAPYVRSKLHDPGGGGGGRNRSLCRLPAQRTSGRGQ